MYCLYLLASPSCPRVHNGPLDYKCHENWTFYHFTIIVVCTGCPKSHALFDALYLRYDKYVVAYLDSVSDTKLDLFITIKMDKFKIYKRVLVLL